MATEKLTVRTYYWIYAFIFAAIIAVVSIFWIYMLWFLVIFVPLFMLGIHDILQKNKNVLRNYPVWGHWRYLLLRIRPEIQAYFIETENSGKPFSRTERYTVYRRAKNQTDTMPFGTQLDVHRVGYEWINHSMTPKKPDFATSTRVNIGGPQCAKPYNASRFNISAMSFGAISPEAIRALNRGAKLGNFHQDTGEGGISRYHLEEGGDLVWELGTGYFGCRTKDGHFDPDQFQKKAQLPNVKMIEIKISQGAKPAHGAILPAAKVNHELAEVRGVEPWKDVLSPPSHSSFSTPIGLMEFIKQLRDLSGGKPTGFKLCIGKYTEFMSICKAMLETGIYPDFIVIDGSQGGTGAAPVEFTNFVGMPLNQSLIFAHSCLCGVGLRQHIRLVASGKVITGFDMLTRIAQGADMINSARGMMFALGCLQSRRCHTNTCPTGVATQDPKRRYALDVDQKAEYVKNFHRNTLNEFLQLLGASGHEKPEELSPRLILQRVTRNTVRSYDQIYDYLNTNDIIENRASEKYMKWWNRARADSFTPYIEQTYRAPSSQQHPSQTEN